MELNISPSLKNIIDKAINLAASRQDEYITPEHVVFALCEEEAFQIAFENLGGDIDNLQSDILDCLDDDLEKTRDGRIKESKGFTDLVMAASICGILVGKKIISVPDFVKALGKIPCSATELIQEQGVKMPSLVKEFNNEYKDENEKVSGQTKLLNSKFNKYENKSWMKNLTLLNESVLKNSMPFIGREAEINRTSEILCRATKNNPILVGEPGVGKTAIVEGLAKLIVDGNVPEKLKNAEIFSVDLSSLVSGASFRGEFENRFKQILDGLEKEVENPVLYVDEIHNLVGLGGGGGAGFDGANIIKKYAQEGKIKFIGTTTRDEYKKVFQKDKGLDRRFKKIDIEEPSVEDSIEILKGLKDYYENFHGVIYTDESIEQAVILSHKFVNSKFLPDKAIDLIDEAGASYSMNKKASDKKKIKITKEMIEEILSKTYHIPKNTLASSDIETLMHLEDNLKSEIFGQDEAAKQIVKSIKRSRAGLNNANKPIASLLFVGPTGVGKTEIAKCVAKQMFGGEDKLIRFDMSEYMEKHTISKLIGSPAGYVGYEEGGLLVDKIIQNPSCVLLFDEIEKAHPDIFNTLLQVMDYATLTDNKGRKADFRNVLIIMTSNAGASASIAPALGFNAGREKKVDDSKMNDAVKNLFPAEFRNRLTDTVIFNPMNEDMAIKIVDKQLNILSNLLLEKNVVASYDDSLKNYLKERGISKDFGAREIQRVIDDEVSDLFIDELFNGKLTKGGNCTVTYSKENGVELKIKAKRTKKKV